MPELVLPAFHLDCRDWLVVDPHEAGLPDELAGAPLLAVLSTVVIDDGGTFTPGSCVLTVGLLEDDLPVRPVAEASVALELLDGGGGASRRYVMPTPDRRLAVLAEVELTEGVGPDIIERVETLMRSFRWAA